MILTDTHAHLYLDSFDEDRDEMLQRAIHNGVKKIILPNIDASTITKMNSLCHRYPATCFPLMGLHPISVKGNAEQAMSVVRSELETHRYYGVGEIGIDLYHDSTYIQEQQKVFGIQLELAVQHDLPVVIHARNSFDEIFNVLQTFKGKGLRGVFHAFTGTVEQAQYIIEEFHFMLGIGGIVTFRNSGLDNVIEHIGTEHLVLETDSPFLSPVPFRGKRNESSYLLNIAGKVAAVKNLSVEELAEITTRNALQLFGIE